jgi:hypothetical protein
MLFLQSIRDMVIRDQAGTMLQQEPLNDGRLGGDNGSPGMQQWKGIET